jgi:hypothetical protein
MKTPKSQSVPIRGKYLNRLDEGSNVVLLDEDLLASFPDSESVNQALRAFLAIGDEIQSVQSVSTQPRHRNGAKQPVRFDPRKGAVRKTASASR